MKRFLFVICLAAITFAQQSSDPKLSIFGSVGAGFKIGGDLYTSITRNGLVVEKEEDIYLNYGGGFKINLGAQLRLMEKLGARAEFAMSFGVPKFEIADKTIIGNTTASTTTEYKRHMYGLKLMVVPQFDFLDLITMYTGVGLGFYWNSLKYETKDALSSDKGKIVSHPALGFNGMLGADYPVSEKFGLFGELGFDLVSFKWKKRVSDEDGTTFYEKDDKNNEAPKKVPGSNWQIRIGAKFNVL